MEPSKKKLLKRGIDPDQKVGKDYDDIVIEMSHLANYIGCKLFVELDKLGMETGRYGLLKDGEVEIAAMPKEQLRAKLIRAVKRKFPRVGESHE